MNESLGAGVLVATQVMLEGMGDMRRRHAQT
jgi:hypothetical protein